jgi:ABC-type multidrug transport system ATPase subunit
VVRFQVREYGTAIVLTSHSMEECEALCTKLAIMAAGQLQCIGSPQHIKNKFGAGFNVVLRVAKQEDMDTVKLGIRELFPDSLLKVYF